MVNFHTVVSKGEKMMFDLQKIFSLRKGLLTSLMLLVMGSTAAQYEAYDIKWIAQFPGKDSDKTQSLGERISRVVFGKRAQIVVKPFNIVADNPGHFWILDQGAGSLFEVEAGEGQIDRSMKKAGLDFPSLVGICRGPGESLLFTDSRLNQLLQVSGGELSIFADSVLLHQPTGIALNKSTGDIWVVETGAHRISILTGEGEWKKSIGKRGAGFGDFNFPTFIWIDSSGRVYVVDSMNFRIQIFDSDGEFLASFGESGDASGNMARPKGVAVDSKGHIYVADALFHVVQIFDSTGNFLFSFGGQGQGEGEFWMPAGIYIDPEDYIYVADSYNARVQVFELVSR